MPNSRDFEVEIQSNEPTNTPKRVRKKSEVIAA